MLVNFVITSRKRGIRAVKRSVLKFFKNIDERNSDNPLEERIFNSFCILMTLTAIVSGVGNYFIELPKWIVWYCFIGAIFGIYSYYLSKVRGRFKLAKLFFLANAYIGGAVIWFFDGGMDGPVSFYMLSLIVLSASLGGKSDFTLLSLNIALISALYFINHLRPELVSLYKTPNYRITDLIGTYATMGVLVYFIVNFLVKNYSKEKAKVEKQRKHLEKLNGELNRVASRDFLTGVLNRRRFIEFSECEIKKSYENKSSFTLVIMDIDNFKQINDSYGHYLGDEVLKEFTAIVRGNVRDSDLFGRLGGDEFILGLVDTDKNEAFRIAERIRMACSGSKLICDECSIKFTVSLGMAEVLSDYDLNLLIKKADKALYIAKNNGRNRVETS